MELLEELHLGPRLRGRAKKALSAVAVRPLAEADLALLECERGTKPGLIKRLRDRHHALARMLASGVGEGTAAVLCGFSGSRVSILKGDPSFKELLAFYRDNVDAQYATLHERLSGLSVDAVEELRSRLEESPEDISTQVLVEITKMSADRTGYGPQSTSTNVNVNVDLAGRLERARKRLQVLEHRPVEE